MPAGPSELLVLADQYANPEYIASDLLSQAEHGPDSQVIFVSLSKSLINDVEKCAFCCRFYCFLPCNRDDLFPLFNSGGAVNANVDCSSRHHREQ